MKAVENIGVFNTKEFHKRYIRLTLSDQSELSFYDKPPTDIHQMPYRSHKLSELVRCRVMDDNDMKTKVDERHAKRSKSVFSVFAHGQSKPCKWNFAFIVTFKEK